MILGSSVALATEKSGLFVGTGTGIVEHKAEIVSESLWQFVAGYKQMIPDSDFGIRAYFNYDANSDMDLLGFNVDLLYNFYDAADVATGVFAGVNLASISYELGGYDDNKLYSGVQAGVRTTIKDNHSIEMFGKLPFTKYELNIQGTKTKIEQKTIIGVRYLYNF